MDEINNGLGSKDNSGYSKIEKYDDNKINRIAELYKEILPLIIDEKYHDDLSETPMRVAKSLQFLTHGYDINPEEIIEVSMFKEDYKQMVIIKDIELYSMCEHHMIPFFGKAHVAYIPNEHITGLSKIARVVEAYARRLQIQERLTTQIRDCIQKTLNPLGVAVVIEAKHMCMIMRGIQKQNSVTTTSAFTGVFMKESKTREEFIHLIGVNLM